MAADEQIDHEPIDHEPTQDVLVDHGQIDTGGLQSILNARVRDRSPGWLPERHIEQVIMAATEVLGVEGVGLVLQDEHDTLRVVGTTGSGAGVLEDAQVELRHGPSWDSILRSATIAVTDLAASAVYRSLWDRVCESGTRAVLSAPVRVRGRPVGNLDATLLHPHEWSREQVRAIEAYAGVVGFTLGLVAQARYWGEISGRLRFRLELVAGGNDLLD